MIPVPTPYGPFPLGALLPLTVGILALPASGYLGASTVLPPVTVHLQAFAGPSGASGTFTNAESVRIE